MNRPRRTLPRLALAAILLALSATAFADFREDRTFMMEPRQWKLG
jgi:hypothetical protein